MPEEEITDPNQTIGVEEAPADVHPSEGDGTIVVPPRM